MNEIACPVDLALHQLLADMGIIKMRIGRVLKSLFVKDNKTNQILLHQFRLVDLVLT
jgi:hypothetical protein